MHTLTLWFYKKEIIKVTPAKIERWSKKGWVKPIVWACSAQDFWCRRAAALALQHVEKQISIPLLLKFLDDKVFTVVEYAIKTLKTFPEQPEIEQRIEQVMAIWEKRQIRFKENWAKKPSAIEGQLFDKSQMVRFNQLKNLLAKQKGSMSIG